MSKQILIVLAVMGAMLLVATGAIAGVLIAGDDDGDGETTAVATATVRPSSGSGKGSVGLTVAFSNSAGGLRVSAIEASGPADGAGLEVGDVIRSIDGQVVRTPEQLRAEVEAKAPGEEVSITYERADRETQARVTLGEADTGAQANPTQTPNGQNQGPAPLRGRLGVTIQQVNAQVQQRLNLTRDNGVVVTSVVEDSAASRAGLEMGDIILFIGATSTPTVESLQGAILLAPTNQTTSIGILRGSEQLTLTATLPPQSNLEGLGNLLPQELRDRLQRLIDEGTLPPEQLQQLLRLYAARGDNVRVGTVKSVNPGIVGGTFILTMTPSGGGSDTTTELNNATSIRRGATAIQPGDLRPNELVLTISMNNGQSAFLVYALGVVN
jgi:membrane-associated protease RseP (regulator of RpoE activity)